MSYTSTRCFPRSGSSSGNRSQRGRRSRRLVSRVRGVALALLAASAAATIACRPGAATPGADLPGVLVHRLPVPSGLDRMMGRAVYTASPSIVVLAPGEYVIADNLFGSGSGAEISGTTHVFRSRDRGANWEPLTVLRGMKRGSLFLHEGALYLWGFSAAPGDIVIRRSADGGSTWTEARDERSGLLVRGTYGGTPQRPAFHGGRVWLAVGGRRVMSAPVDADLLAAESWEMSDQAKLGEGAPAGKRVISEAQVVASPETGVVVLPKVGGLPMTVLFRVKDGKPGKLLTPGKEDWIDFPGGEKKFAVGRDPETGLFLALSNPVLPAYRDSGWPPEMIRNAAALLVSRDLRDWRTVEIFLESSRVDYEAFQYLSFDFDGDDLVVASRTAFALEGIRPPRGHDSNLTTFHRIANFRERVSKVLP
jgi:hypothetical protein